MKLHCDTHFLNSLSAAEIEVASILLELPRLFAESVSGGLRPVINWGARKRRSSVDTPSVSLPTSSSQPPPVPPVSVPVAVGPSCEVAAEIATNKADRTSPTTPLSFPPSESEDKSKKSNKRVSMKRKRQELSELVEELTQRKQLFTRELETVKKYYEEQKVLNLLLKKKEAEMIREKKKSVENREPLWLSPVDDKMGRAGGLPDLNVTPAETTNDTSKALAAAARKRRIDICRSKLRHMQHR